MSIKASELVHDILKRGEPSPGVADPQAVKDLFDITFTDAEWAAVLGLVISFAPEHVTIRLYNNLNPEAPDINVEDIIWDDPVPNNDGPKIVGL